MSKVKRTLIFGGIQRRKLGVFTDPHASLLVRITFLLQSVMVNRFVGVLLGICDGLSEIGQANFMINYPRKTRRVTRLRKTSLGPYITP
jgi:hypothetical protein